MIPRLIPHLASLIHAYSIQGLIAGQSVAFLFPFSWPNSNDSSAGSLIVHHLDLHLIVHHSEKAWLAKSHILAARSHILAAKAGCKVTHSCKGSMAGKGGMAALSCAGSPSSNDTSNDPSNDSSNDTSNDTSNITPQLVPSPQRLPHLAPLSCTS